MTTPKRFFDATDGTPVWVRSEDVRVIGSNAGGVTTMLLDLGGASASTPQGVQGTVDEAAQKVWGASPPLTVQTEVPEVGTIITVECGVEQVEVGGRVYRVRWSAQLEPA